MTPTLRGRWQTRLLLNLTIGIGAAALVGYFYQDFLTPFAVLGYLTGFGLVWDWIYMKLQSRRWDHDWSPALYLAGAVWELLVFVIATQLAELPGISSDYRLFPMILQDGMMGILSFFMIFGPIRILFPRWRFRGGQWL